MREDAERKDVQVIQLDPKDLEEVRRVAREYSEAFRTADSRRALDLTILPVVDCIDLGSRAGVYLMDAGEFAHLVEEHRHEDFTTEIVSLDIQPLGKNAALARVEAEVRKPDGRVGQVEWVEFLARTAEGWKVWANWLGPYPDGF